MFLVIHETQYFPEIKIFLFANNTEDVLFSNFKGHFMSPSVFLSHILVFRVCIHRSLYQTEECFGLNCNDVYMSQSL